jgi:hypothetical protein
VVQGVLAFAIAVVLALFLLEGSELLGERGGGVPYTILMSLWRV